MTFLRPIAVFVSSWIGKVAALIVALNDRVGSPRLVRLTERQDGAFALPARRKASPPRAPEETVRISDGRLEAPDPARLRAALKGAHVELLLQPNRFVFRPLDLPSRAADVLAGIVGAQIDRLTPWSATDAAFGWSEPEPLADDRIRVTVAATARALVAPLAKAVEDFGADRVSVVTPRPQAEPGAAAIRVLDRRPRGAIEARRLRPILASILGASGLLASAALVAAVVYGNDLDDRRYGVLRDIAERRAALEIGQNSPDKTGGALLAQRKHQVPASVIVLDALSQIMPDHTYLTELRVQADTLQIVGLTRDAPSLIRLMEQSSHFTRATFFAPTTHAPNEVGERFNIEARIEPVYTPGQ